VVKGYSRAGEARASRCRPHVVDETLDRPAPRVDWLAPIAILLCLEFLMNSPSLLELVSLEKRSTGLPLPTDLHGRTYIHTRPSLV
jgi:hypothetical protein